MIGESDLLRLLICPDCSEALSSVENCPHCGAVFSQQDGIPSIFPTIGKKTVEFQFTMDRSTTSAAFTKCFSYPLRRGSPGPGKPYHLDDAHLAVIEKLNPNSTVLEIGCGGAQMRRLIEAEGHRYVGADISKPSADKAPDYGDGPDFLCDAHFLPIANDCVDLVYISAFTEHAACPYLIAQQVARCLKPGGYYLGNVSFLEPWHADSFFHMTPLGVFELLTQAKLEAIHIWPGVGYSGFRAVLAMGNKVTRPLAFLGTAVHVMYATGNRARNLVKRRKGWMTESISDAARVSGATDWIARRAPL
jgi:SAM-dependent methyltransferase/uncharacterized protein YbaR (Trm112 family)